MWALHHFRAYLLGHRCIVCTDHSPLKAALAAPHSSGRRARWSDTLAEFDVEIRYRPGRTNSNSDALSRAPLSASTGVNVVTTMTPDQHFYCLVSKSLVIILKIIDKHQVAMMTLLSF